MLDSFINYMDKFGPEILVIQAGFLVIISTLFLWLWFSNRRKYHNLKHAIPANVVKSYLDSIIQNSTSLKSQLFRGGGLDLGSVPSVLPLHGLTGGDNIGMSGAPSTALLEELNQRKAQIASLESQLASAHAANRELEAKIAEIRNQLAAAEAKIRELEALLAKNRGGSGDEALKAELAMVAKERDELRDRLKEFEIIADDLANLKRLQQENEQLKRSLAAQGGSLPQVSQAPIPAQASAPAAKAAEVSDLFEDLNQTTGGGEDNSALEEFLSEAPADPLAKEANLEEMLAVGSNPAPESNRPKSDKTPEDLLSEFEKMLG